MRPFWQKKNKKSASVSVDAPQNAYYEKLSAHFGIAQVLLFSALLAFALLSFLFNMDLITYRNFYHFFKDLNASAETVDIFNADTVAYPTSQEQSFTVWRRGLAVAGNKTVTAFSATGRQILSESIQYRDPVAVGSGKYLLVYERGGRQYSLYNSSTCLYTGKSDYPIYGATVSESGMYALISRTATSNSAVLLYNERFGLHTRYPVDNGYITDVSLDDGGKRIAILSVLPANGLFTGQLMVVDTNKKAETGRATLADTTVLSCRFTEAGQIAVLSPEGIFFYNDKAERSYSYEFDGRTLACFDMGDGGVALCLKENIVSATNTLIAFDKHGKIVYNGTTHGSVEQLSLYGETVFYMTDTGVWRKRITGNHAEHFEECVTAGRTLLAISEEEALCCTVQKAYYVSFR